MYLLNIQINTRHKTFLSPHSPSLLTKTQMPLMRLLPLHDVVFSMERIEHNASMIGENFKHFSYERLKHLSS